jgi:uncharacterized protein (DUF58 family)
MITTRARVVVSLLLLSLIGALATGRQLFYNLVYLWAALLLTSFFWARSALLGISLERKPRSSRAQVGSLFLEQFWLRNRSRIPKLWLEARDLSDLPGYKVTTVAVGLGFRKRSDLDGHRRSTVTVSLGRGHERTWTVRTLCTRRGRFRLGPLRIMSGDPFGLFPVSLEVPQRQHFVVLPMIVPIPEFPMPSGRLPGGEALRQRTHQVTPNASSVRDYAPGDSLNRIHWPSTAKRNRLISKEFEFDPLADIWVLLDGSRRAQFAKSMDEMGKDEASPIVPGKPTLPPSTEEYGVSAAASVAFHFLQRDRAVGMVAYGRTRHVIQPDHGESQLYRILESLAVLNALGRNNLEDVIKVEGPRIPRGATVVVITASNGEDVLAAVRRLDYAGRRAVLVLMDAESFGGPVGTQAIASASQRAGIPVRVIRCGEPLDVALSEPSPFRRVSTAA